MSQVRFSLATDIVELVVLTADETFLQTLREAVGASRRLWHVPASDKVGDLLLAGGVGILVLDVHALRQPCASFITHLKEQFPDLVVVVAGARDAEAELAPLISDGTVYRFIHKPMSPARARLFADAAVKRLEEQRRRAGEAMAAARPARNPGRMIAGGCAAICAIAGGIWALTSVDRERGAGPAPGTAAVDAAGPALTAEPPTRGASPDGEIPAGGTARRAGADSGRMPLLSAEPAKARQRVSKTPAAVGDASPAPDPAEQSAALALQRIHEGRLIETERDGVASDRIASPANVDNLRQPLGAAAHQAGEGPGLPPATEESALPPVPATVPAAALAPALAPAAPERETATAPVARAPSRTDVIDAAHLDLVKSVPPQYPQKAPEGSIEGWVELEFTVAESGRVKDISVHAANPRGVFDQAAREALLQWRYKPVLADAKPVSQRARIRIRFALAQ